MRFKETLARDSAEPLYRQVYRILLGAILDGQPEPGEKLPDIRTLADGFGVSIMPVNRALDELIRKGYCVRRPKQGTFVARGIPPAAGESSGKTIILYSDNENSEFDLVDVPFYTHIRKIVEHTCQANLLILSGKRASQELEPQLEQRRGECLGVIFIAVCSLRIVLEHARKYPGIRFVLLNYQFPAFAELAPPNLTGVFNDEFCGGYLGCTHLIARGRRRFGILQYEVGDENYRLRIAGFQQAHADSRTVLAADSVLDVGITLPPIERGYNGIAALLERDPRLDAVFCVNDILAAGACKYLNSKGVRDQVEIIGYDNHIPELHRVNRFATIAINTEMMSAAVLRMLTEPNDNRAKQLLIAPRLVLPTPE